MKKGILIDAFDNKEWIGGLYYKRNILYSLLQNNHIREKYRIVVVTYPDNLEIFHDFGDKIALHLINFSGYREMQAKMLGLCMRYRCKYIFPSENQHYRWLGLQVIAWLPDFQHNYFPNFFSEEELENRTRRVYRIIEKDIPLILSSNECLNDFRKYYSMEYNKVFVVPFVSYIESLVKNITADKEDRILCKYNLSKTRYACIMNQFWQHKNHMVVFRALIKFYKNNPESNFVFVFTGKMDDYRRPDYINSIRDVISEPVLKDRIRMLGLIERDEQVLLMKKAEFIIQPSLFEGWGTVLEDAKVLDKTVLLSDIRVHREQCHAKSKLFDPYDADMLAAMIEEETKMEHVDDVANGFVDMRNRAEEYSKQFQRLLDMRLR